MPDNLIKQASALICRGGFHLFDWWDHSDRMQELKKLLKSQYASPDALRNSQLVKLQAISAYAWQHVPYYRKAWGAAPQFTLESFKMLPILTKAAIRAAGDELITQDPTISGKLESAKTGGSTGVSLKLKFDFATQQHRNAAALRSDMWAGWRPGQWTGGLWGSPPRPEGLKQQARNLLRNRLLYLDTMRLDAQSMGAFLDLMRQGKIDALFGHAHSLFILADFAITSGLYRKLTAPKAIVSTSMMLLQTERARIEEAFGTKVSDRYGCEEVGLIAAECEQHSGYHITSEHLLVEILDDNDKPCKPGEIGRVILTDLQNKGMPLIRYEVGDLSAWSTTPCPCGRGLPTLERVVGRQADCLIRLDGSLVAGVSLVERTLLVIPGIAQLQLIQTAADQVMANTVLDGTVPFAKVYSQLTAALRADLGPTMVIWAEEKTRLDQEANGKYRFAIRKF